jgi:vitamin B12 transporter
VHARVLLVATLCGLLAGSSFSPLFAQEPPPEFVLPDVVSPGRRPQPAAASPASVSVLTGADLRRLGVRTVGEAIAFVPEAQARAYGGPGSLITPSIRGSSAEQVLVLLDGIPLNGVFAGTVDLSTIPIDDVERIEVLRGPFSAIYGSGALGGVISIITRRRAPPSLAAGGGSLGAISLAASGGGVARLSLRYDSTGGDRPNSDLRAGAFSLRLGEVKDEAKNTRSWDLNLLATSAARGAPGSTAFPTPLARQDDRRIAAAFTAQRTSGMFTDRWRLTAHLDRIAYRDPLFGLDDRHDGAAWGAEWLRTLRVSDRRVVAIGVDASMQQLSSTSVGERSATSGALYLQDDRALGERVVVSGGLRADWHSVFGAQINPRIGLVYFVRPDLRLRLAAGRTYRGPTFADLYYPFDGFAAGNPNLRPEQAWSVDAGIESSIRPGLVVRAAAFWSDVRDLIVWMPDAAFVWSPQNVGAASVLGASAELDGALSAVWRARGSLTWMRVADASGGLDLPNRPRVSGSLSLTRSLYRGASLTASAVFAGERFADAANTLRLPAYMTAALTAQVPVSEALLLRATIQNLFDARYEPVQGYPAPGRTVFVEMVLRR